MGYRSKADKAEANRRYRAKKALEAGREPGKNGRPKTYGPPKPRKFKGHGDRQAQYLRRRERTTIANADHGWVVTQHPIMDEAIAVANATVKRDYRDKVAEDLWDDVVCEAALAIIEGTDPYEAAQNYKRYYNDFKYHCRTGEEDRYYLTLMEIPQHKEIV